MSERAAAWVYAGVWRGLAEWFRVPQEPPDLPAQPDERVDRFQPAQGFLDYLKLWFWIVAILIDIALFVGLVAASVALIMVDLWWLLVLVIPVTIVIMIVPDIVGYVAIHLRFDTTWYVMTDRSLRIRRGIFVIQETTITFENVQNIRVQQGPVQRYYGIGTLIVETAGGGSATSQGKGGIGTANLGVIEGVADAAGLRERILPHLRGAPRNAGLGDEEVGTGGMGWTAEHVAVLREIRDHLSPAARDD